jgi:predicted Zn-dependent protease
MKRGFSFLGEDNIGEKVFSDQFTLTDDPTIQSTFPYQRDFYGLDRKPFPIFKDGVFQAFTWFQDDADEFSAQPTGHTVNHKSLVLQGGEGSASSLAELIAQPRDRDLLYIPFLHYMNIVNPSKGVITATSRFGTLLLKANGEVAVPYNVRLTQSLLDVFGDGIDWMSKDTVAYNTSSSYGARNPTAVVVPVLLCVNGLEISHSNDAF